MTIKQEKYWKQTKETYLLCTWGPTCHSWNCFCHKPILSSREMICSNEMSSNRRSSEQKNDSFQFGPWPSEPSKKLLEGWRSSIRVDCFASKTHLLKYSLHSASSSQTNSTLDSKELMHRQCTGHKREPSFSLSALQYMSPRHGVKSFRFFWNCEAGQTLGKGLRFKGFEAIKFP